MSNGKRRNLTSVTLKLGVVQQSRNLKRRNQVKNILNSYSLVILYMTYTFLVFEPNHSIGENTIIEPHDAVFYENRFVPIPKVVNEVNEPISQGSDTEAEPSKQITLRRKKGLTCKVLCDFIVYLVVRTRKITCNHTMISFMQNRIP